jgi:DNA processing protein
VNAELPAVRLLHRGEPGWPEALEHLDLPPPALWLCGPHPPGGAAVAVVGSRDATHAGLEIARRLAGDLAAAGIPVISGMALGVDGAAHLGALDAGGVTVGVLGCGIDVSYPQRHRALRGRVARTGLLLTEEPPGTFPAPWRFPRRNRIIAALATAVVVVEASDRSGALSTARHALDLGREVFAVPGSVLSERSAGANRLIRDGAVPLTETRDLAAVPALAAAVERAAPRFVLTAPADHRASVVVRPAGPSAPRGVSSPESSPVLRRLSHDPVHPTPCPACSASPRRRSPPSS